jgi:hypothetical protein
MAILAKPHDYSKSSIQNFTSQTKKPSPESFSTVFSQSGNLSETC